MNPGTNGLMRKGTRWCVVSEEKGSSQSYYYFLKRKIPLRNETIYIT